MLHFTRSYSGRSLAHIPSSGWTTKSISTQTEEEQQEQPATNSLKRMPRWKRTRLRKSIAVMESTHSRAGPADLAVSEAMPPALGIVNPGFSYSGGLTVIDAPDVRTEKFVPEVEGRSRQLFSTGDLPEPRRYSSSVVPMRGCSSVDNLLDAREHRRLEEDFMLKYRQVSGDLRSSCDLVELARKQEAEVVRDRSFIESKAVRKEKRKKRWRNVSADRLADVRRPGGGHDRVGVVDDGDLYGDVARHCYVNPGLDSSSPLIPALDSSSPLIPCGKENRGAAPLAHQEICDLSPVPRPGDIFNRHSKYNTSYRLATNQPATPVQRMPRTSTQVCLDNLAATVNSSQPTTKHHLLLRRRPQVEMSTAAADDCLYVRAEPYLCNNSEASSVVAAPVEALYTRPRVGGPLQRYTVSGILGGGGPLPLEQGGNPLLVRHSVARLSRSSQATVDSGRYSDLRQVLSIRVENSNGCLNFVFLASNLGPDCLLSVYLTFSTLLILVRLLV